MFGFHGSWCVCGTQAAALQRPSCRVDDGLNLSWAASGTHTFPWIDFFTLSGSCDSAERLRVRWEDQSRRWPFCYMCNLGKSRKLDFSCMMESGSSKQRHLAPTQSKAGRLQLPKSPFNSWNHESRQSGFQIESMSAGSSCFFMPILTEFCHIQSRFLSLSTFFLSFFFFYRAWLFAISTYLNNSESTDAVKVWFSRCLKAHSLFLSDTAEKLLLLRSCSFWCTRSSCRWNLMKCFYNVQYSEMRTKITWSGPTEMLSVIKQHQ